MSNTSCVRWASRTGHKRPCGRFVKDWFDQAGDYWVNLLWLALLGGLTLGIPEVRADVIYVRVLVDEEEPKREEAWKVRLKQRVDRASAIISTFCNVRFAVKDYGTWRSDNRIADLNRSLREFEQEVSPDTSRIAIGFSSQYKFHKGRNGLGGTRGPLHTHILLRESSPKTTEPERLEALVHELGHFLGAAHSSQITSVMRPVIGDGRARAKNYRIGFDPQNAKIIRLVANEMNSLRVRRFHQLSELTRNRLRQEYQFLARQLPKDPAAKQFLKYLNQQKSTRPVKEVPLAPLQDYTKE